MTLGLSGCAVIHGVAPPGAPGTPSHHFRAGAAKVDITPVPGFPMGGHSLGGRVSRGVWLRLHARAIYLEDARGTGLAFVACDLWSLPSGLSDRVADLLASGDFEHKLGKRRLGREQIVLAASHTHQGPGLFSSDKFFSAFAAPKPGFEPALHEFLAWRIAWAIAEAVGRAEPAGLALTGEPVSEVFRNRSIDALRMNPKHEVEAVMAESSSGPCAPTPLFPDPDACRAVDTRLRVLQIRRAGGNRSLLALGVFLAMHPALVAHDLELYSADLFGALAGAVERRLAVKRPGSEVVVAVFNGPEGDVSGQWTSQTRGDVRRIGGLLADKVIELAGQTRSPQSGTIRMAFEPQERLWLRLRPKREAGRGLTAALPMPGRATAGGAEDGRIDVPHWISHEGKRGVNIPPHGRKIGQIDLVEVAGWTLPPFWLTRLALVLLPPPRRVALGVYGVGEFVFATLPGEFTTVLGRRIVEGIAAKTGVDRDRVVLLGLSQSYASYFATPEEYALQHYEGSGMLYGTYSGQHIAHRLEELAGELSDHRDSQRRDYFYLPWFAGWLQHRRDALGVEVPPEQIDEGLAPVLFPIEGDAELLAFPRACWDEARHGLPGVKEIGRHAIPRIRTEVETARGWQPLIIDGFREDDTGMNFVVAAGRIPDTRSGRWCVYWIAPEGIDEDATYRFAYSWQEGSWDYSEEFGLDSAAP